MQEEHRKAIQLNIKSLVEQTDLNTMVLSLYEKGVFSSQMIEKYKDTSRDVRNRKFILYSDIMRRGPRAFQNLLDVLMENGYWDLVRDLDPKSLPSQSRRWNTQPAPTNKNLGDSNFVSIKTERAKIAKNIPQNKDVNKNLTHPAYIRPGTSDAKEPIDSAGIPHFKVIKSEKFMEETGDGMTLYRTRGRRRGVLVIFSYVDFNNMEAYRRGADVDCKKLKYLFIELGFKVLAYQDLTKEETLQTLNCLKEVVCGAESVFLVVSSHGHARANTTDNDFRCHDGGLISVSEILERFNNKNFPSLRGTPKVFIFQICRGSNEDYLMLPGASTDGTPVPPAQSPPPRRSPGAASGSAPAVDRNYSDILIAHSTIPGNVSYRDEVEGSWYIQALCEVFAEHAHRCHVEELFTLVDRRLHDARRVQTSSVDRWGFNSRLYLHPGLVDPDEDAAPS